MFFLYSDRMNLDTHRNSSNYNSAYVKIYVMRQKAGRQEPNWTEIW